jgi:hypothetical protein
VMGKAITTWGHILVFYGRLTRAKNDGWRGCNSCEIS